tara:strand:+ start:4887 stop:5513 length:627 start_codon:yes stop_codon:yes gene_type:complete
MLQFQPHWNQGPQSDYTQIYHKKGVFNDQMIAHLEQMVHREYKFEKGMTGIAERGTVKYSGTNNRDIAYIQPNESSHWLYDLLFPLALEANSKHYHFDIDTVTDPIHYVIYPEDEGHLDWHYDVGALGVNRRKLAMTVQLSDSNDYTGGEFQIMSGGSKGGGEGVITLPREKGDVMVFPSFLMHRVAPIKSGRRKCLVFWTGSNRSFR